MGDDIVIELRDYNSDGLIETVWSGPADEFLAMNDNNPDLVDAVGKLRGGLERVEVNLGASGTVCLARALFTCE